MTKDLPFYYFNRLCIKKSNWIFRQVLDTPPIKTDPSSNIILYSILDKPCVNAYLLAVKSFLRYCPPMNVVIQSDGTLDNKSCQTLRSHIRNCAIIPRENTELYLRDKLQKQHLQFISDTNFWVELKLLNPLVRFSKKYVILFDSDLLFIRPPDAVVECLTASRPRSFFSPGGNILADPFHKIGFDFSKVDVRSFNAGFIGIDNVIQLDSVVDLYNRISKYDKKLLSVWDVEQASWAVLMNQCDNPLPLKSVDEHFVENGWKSYALLKEKATMVHFVGATRYRNWMYPKLAKMVIKELLQI